MTSAGNSLSKAIKKRLIDNAGMTEDTLQLAIEQSEESGQRVHDVLVKEAYISGTDLAEIFSKEYASPVYDVESHNLDLSPQDIVDTKLLQKHRVLPLFKRGSKLYIAVSDPTDNSARSEIRFQTGLSVESVLAPVDKLESMLEEFFKSSEDSLDESFTGDGDLDGIDVEGMDENDSDNDNAPIEADEAPIVKFVNKVLVDTIKSGASDIHFEPYEKSYRIRARIDGVLAEVSRPPTKLASRLAARLKVMSRMDISERRKPQDGRIKLRVSKNRSIDFRVNTLPTLYGEKIVLRILDPGSAQMGIEALGYEDYQKELYLDALHQPQGMILITGPTGSGKTVSLYTGLNILNTEERNISTAEDPVEINLEGINQVHVSNKTGLTFAEALRSFLRQDPDIVMVGEIRDLETAEIAIKAAQTGHLVLSTLHTNSGPETLTRLLNMGVPAFNVASSVSLIIAQRLARRLCSSCKKPADIPEAILEQEGFYDLGIEKEEIQIMEAEGCKDCGDKGSRGRTGVYEVMKNTPEIAKMIMEGGNSLEIAQLSAKQGFNDLRTSALRKVAMGLISLEEANRVTTD